MNDFLLFNGDALECMDKIKKVDAIITDPPYMINIKSSGTGKIDPWADLINASFWYSAWIKKAKDHLKDTGCMWVFTNWRSLTTIQKASCDNNWLIESILIWDKKWIGPGGQKGLRPSYEMICLFCMPDFKIENRSIPDIKQVLWSSKKPHGHPAEKPVDLIKFLIDISTKENDIILDPFMGSGTTGAAALSMNRDFYGIEMNEKWYNVSKTRLKTLLGDFNEK